MKIYNKILIFVTILLVTTIFFSKEGIAPTIPNDEDHLFNSYSTYPNSIANLKPLHLEFSIVDNNIPESIIVVNTADSSYLSLARDIQNKINTLTGTNVQIKDDDSLIESDYSKNIILIGNYYTNSLIKKEVYLKQRQLIDIDRPSTTQNSFLINRVRISSPHGIFTNAIVLSAQNFAKVNESVQYFINNILPQTPQNSIILGPQANYWGNAPSGNPPGSVGYSTSIGYTAVYANRYWQTGNMGYATAFYDILSNIGWLCSDLQHSFNPDPNNYHQPGWYPAQGQPNAKYWPGGPQELGDNAGGLEFNILPAIIGWRNMEASVMERGIFTSEERLYITQVLNYLSQMLYNFSWVSTPFESFVPYNNEPSGNHETGAARSLMAAGQYFGTDGYSYSVEEATTYSLWPNNNAYQWMIASDNAMTPYINLSYTNDDAGGYWYGTPYYFRTYAWLTNKTEALNHFNNEGGMFNEGTDKGVSDFYIIIQPNNPKEAGFGDVGGIKGHDFDPLELRFWWETYNDGRYVWLLNRMIETGNANEHLGADDLAKPILLFGLAPVPEEIIPTEYLGVFVVPLEETMYNYLNAYNGQSVPGYPGVYYFGSIYFGYPPTEAHVPLEEAFNKITFRTSFDEQDQFMLIDGIGALGHGHHDHLAILEFWDNERLFLMDHSWDDDTKRDHSGIEVKKDGETASWASSSIAGVKDTASFDQTGFVHMELPQYGKYIDYGYQPGEWSTDVSRSIFWKKEKFFFILDEVKANDDGDYELTLNWRSLGEFSGEGTDTINVEQQGEHFVVTTPDANYIIEEDYTNQNAWAYSYATPNQNGTLRTTFTYNLQSSGSFTCCESDCLLCENAICSSYPIEQTCNDDPCNIGNCYWDGNSCLEGEECINGQQRNCPLQYGVCSGSYETCTNNVWPGCNINTYLSFNPNYEVTEISCNDGLDNDCDNLIDSNDPDCQLECINGQTQLCPLQYGVCLGSYETCTNNVWPGCTSTTYSNWAILQGWIYEENIEVTCDDLLDNDCDNLIDTNDPDCALPTCEAQNGYICEPDEYCTGEILPASNTNNCCSVPCSTALLCSQCGGLFGFGCSRDECYNIPENCYFIDVWLWPNDCNSCSGATCSSYTADPQTCIDDPCNIGCEWTGNECVESGAGYQLNTEGLILHWNFDDGSTITDQSGNNYNGNIASGTLEWIQNTPNNNEGYSLYLDNNDLVSLNPGIDILPQNSNYTVMAWYKTSNFDNNYLLIWDMGYSAGTESFIKFPSTNNLNAKVQLGGSTHPALLTTTPTTSNEWNHIAIVFDNKTGQSPEMKLYTNGDYIETITTTSPTTGGKRLRILSIGQHDSSPQYYNGYIDEVFLFNRTLDESEISSYYNAWLNIPPGCGDGQINVVGEECDDGNTNNGDGCSSSCLIEQGWTCNGQPSMCDEICGDSLVVGEEDCDPGPPLNLNGQTCESLGYNPGTLACYAPGTVNECTFNYENCGELITGNYYVDNNPSICENNYITHGTSLNNPWCTIQFATDSNMNNPVTAGDTIYVREGVYREDIMLLKMGTQDAYITLKSWNNEEVIIDGSIELTNWLQVGTNIYSTTTSYPKGTFVDDNLIEEVWPFPDETVTGRTLDEYLDYNQWTYNNGQIYIKLQNSPSNYKIEVPSKSYGIINTNTEFHVDIDYKYWIIDGFTVRRFNTAGIRATGNSSHACPPGHYMIIRNNIIEYNDYYGISIGWCPGVIIENNTIQKSGIRRQNNYGSYRYHGVGTGEAWEQYGSTGNIWRSPKGTNCGYSNCNAGPELLYVDNVEWQYNYTLPNTEDRNTDPTEMPVYQWTLGIGGESNDSVFIHFPAGDNPNNHIIKRAVFREDDRGHGIVLRTREGPESAGRFIIRNNQILSVNGKGISMCGGSGQECKYTVGSIVYNNYIFNSGESGYDSGSSVNVTFSYNVLWQNGVRDLEDRDDDGGDKGFSIPTNKQGWKVHHNVIQSSGNHDAFLGSGNTRIFHNTIVKDKRPVDQNPNCGNWGGFAANLRRTAGETGTDIVLKNNIFAITGEGIITDCASNLRALIDCHSGIPDWIDCEIHATWNGNNYYTEEEDKTHTLGNNGLMCFNDTQNPIETCSIDNKNLYEAWPNQHRTDSQFDSFAMPPEFMDQENNNLRLQSNSPMIDVGVPLTNTTQSSTSNIVYVDDPLYFHDIAEYPGIPNEKVIINNQLCTIIDVDYSENWIQCNETITYSNNNKVYWNYVGAKPDIGAFEYGEENIELICNDLIDNDGDNLIDCEDPDCYGKIGPGGSECCSSSSHCQQDDCVIESCEINNECSYTNRPAGATDECNICEACNLAGGDCTGITANNGKNCNNDCDSCIAGICTIRNLNNNIEVTTTCYYCNGINSISQSYTGEAGINCIADCYDCLDGSCNPMTENNDGLCNDDCNSCILGICTNRQQCDTTECTIGKYCDSLGGNCINPNINTQLGEEVCEICALAQHNFGENWLFELLTTPYCCDNDANEYYIVNGIGAISAEGCCDNALENCVDENGVCRDEYPTETTCNDGIDNDCDSHIDLDDSDCEAECINGEQRNCPLQYGVCSGSYETCTNNVWPGCTSTTYSNWAILQGWIYEENIEVTCDDLLDNDCDNLADCQDDGCYGLPGPNLVECCSFASHCQQDDCVTENCIDNECNYENRPQCDTTECTLGYYCDSAGGDCINPNEYSLLGETVCEICNSSYHNFTFIEPWSFELLTTPYCCNNDPNETYVDLGELDVGPAACCDNALENCVDENGVCRDEYPTETTCNDGIDNDCDSHIDCDDSDCEYSSACVAETCEDCGLFLGLPLFCSRVECEAIPEGCYFIDNFLIIPNDCIPCSSSTTCESYSNILETCENDTCGLGNCIWSSNTCITSSPPPGPESGGGGSSGGGSYQPPPPTIEEEEAEELPLALQIIDFTGDSIEITLEEGKGYLMKIDNYNYTLNVPKVEENYINLNIDSIDITVSYDVKGKFDLIDDRELYITLLNIDGNKATVKLEVKEKEIPTTQEVTKRTTTADIITKNTLIISFMVVFIILIALILFYFLKIKPKKFKYNKEEVKKTIEDAFKKGYSKEKIKNKFLKEGWPEKLINKLLK